MFNIALALVLSWDDDGQTVFLAKPVGGAADIVIASLVGMIVLVIRKADRIENQVVMNMIFVCSNFKKMDLVPIGDIQTYRFQDKIDFLGNHHSSVFGRTDKMIEKDANIMALVDIQTHISQYTPALQE